MSLLIQEMIGAAERKLAVERQEIDRHWAAAKTMRASIGISRLTAIQPGAGERLVSLSRRLAGRQGAEVRSLPQST